MELGEVRKEIDKVDEKIRTLFMERMLLADHVACIKAKTEDVIYKPEREVEIIKKQTEGMNPKLVREYTALIKRIMEVSRKYQYGRILEERNCFPFQWQTKAKEIKTMVFFHKENMLSQWSWEKVGRNCRPSRWIKAESMEEIGKVIKEGKADAGIGTLEKVGVGVSDELHMLLLKEELFITHCLVKEEEGIRKKIVIFTDTLEVLPEHNRVKLMFSCPNHSGSLSSILSMISDYGVNVTEIHSSPFLEADTWNYRFFVELNVNIDTKESHALLYQLSQETQELKILGSYLCEGDF